MNKNENIDVFNMMVYKIYIFVDINIENMKFILSVRNRVPICRDGSGLTIKKYLNHD